MFIASSLGNAMRRVSDAVINAMPCMGTYTVNSKVRVAKGTVNTPGKPTTQWESRLELPIMDVGKYRITSREFPETKQNPDLTSASRRRDVLISDEANVLVSKEALSKLIKDISERFKKDPAIVRLLQSNAGASGEVILPPQKQQEIRENLIAEYKALKAQALQVRDLAQRQDTSMSGCASSSEAIESASPPDVVQITPETAITSTPSPPRKIKNYITQVTTQAEIHGKPGKRRGAPLVPPPSPPQRRASSPEINDAISVMAADCSSSEHAAKILPPQTREEVARSVKLRPMAASNTMSPFFKRRNIVSSLPEILEYPPVARSASFSSGSSDLEQMPPAMPQAVVAERMEAPVMVNTQQAESLAARRDISQASGSPAIIVAQPQLHNTDVGSRFSRIAPATPTLARAFMTEIHTVFAKKRTREALLRTAQHIAELEGRMFGGGRPAPLDLVAAHLENDVTEEKQRAVEQLPTVHSPKLFEIDANGEMAI